MKTIFHLFQKYNCQISRNYLPSYIFQIYIHHVTHSNYTEHNPNLNNQQNHLLSPIQINQSNDNESLHTEWTPENISHEVWKSIIIHRITLSLQSTITGRYTVISLQTSHNTSHNNDNNPFEHIIALVRVLNIRPYNFIIQKPWT